jgi:hypothetical protein
MAVWRRISIGWRAARSVIAPAGLARLITQGCDQIAPEFAAPPEANRLTVGGPEKSGSQAKDAAGGQEIPSAALRSAVSFRFSIKSGDFATFGPVAFAVRIWHSSAVAGERSPPSGRGCSSVVEHDLAKVGVEGSSPFARSKFPVRRTGFPQKHLRCFAAHPARHDGCAGFRLSAPYSDRTPGKGSGSGAPPERPAVP